MNNVNLKSDFRLNFFQGFIEIKRTIPITATYMSSHIDHFNKQLRN